MRARCRGFSLLELLIAMSLFMVMGSALIALVTRAMDFLDTGAGGSELTDKGADFLRTFVGDLENVAVERSRVPGPPAIRFLADFVPVDSDGDGKADMTVQRVAFVRSTTAEFTDPVARRGGASAEADAYFDGRNDKEESETGKLKSLGGLEEVLYMAIPRDAKKPGILTLYRARRSPIGGPGSLLNRETVMSGEDLRKVADPLMEDVLHFGVRFWTPRATTWETALTPGGADAASMTWDSTRGILPVGRGPGEFHMAKGPQSYEDPRDDISPRMVRVTFVADRSGREGDTGYLMGDLDEGGRRLMVGPTTAFALQSAMPFVKVDWEWISWAERGEGHFAVQQRGAWGTAAATHASGAIVRAGYAVERTVVVPNYREDWNTR